MYLTNLREYKTHRGIRRILITVRQSKKKQVQIFIFTQPLRSGRIWHKVNI